MIIVILANQPSSSISVYYVKYEDSLQSIYIDDAISEIIENVKNAVIHGKYSCKTS